MNEKDFKLDEEVFYYLIEYPASERYHGVIHAKVVGVSDGRIYMSTRDVVHRDYVFRNKSDAEKAYKEAFQRRLDVEDMFL